MKQWIDMVLEHNWAYGKGKALQNKIIFKSLQQVAIKKIIVKLAAIQYSRIARAFN
jgi:glutathione-regulated potassium-efflux system ancillary protein KefG